MRTDGAETILEVNNIFHQSMAPVGEKEYFYQWPYMVFGNSFDDVLILGAGSGTDVAASLMHGAKRVDAVEIDPAILRLGAALVGLIGANLLGAMVGGVAEYLSLVTGFRWLLLLVAAFYVAALLTRRATPSPLTAPAGTR